MTYDLERLRVLSGMTKTALQEHLSVSGREWTRYYAEGVSWRVADRCASRCGFHPAEVWPEWIDDAAEEQRRAVLDRANERRRKRYAESEDARRARQASARAYYRDHGDYVRARERRKYQANTDAIRARRRELYARSTSPQVVPSHSQGCCPSDPQLIRGQISPMGFDREVG